MTLSEPSELLLLESDLDVEPLANEEDRQIATATIYVPGSALIARESSKDLYASVDGMIDKLQRQLKKYKDKLRMKNRHEAMKTKRQIRRIETPQESNPATNQEEPVYYIPKPMYVEDAAVIMEEHGHQFYVFRNAENEKINVIYITESGDFGVIEP